jgi:hypothetical protein
LREKGDEITPFDGKAFLVAVAIVQAVQYYIDNTPLLLVKTNNSDGL